MHDLLRVHAVTTVVLAAFMWTLQVLVVPGIARANELEWPRQAVVHRRAFRWIFWPMILVEASSGIGIAILRPPGIPFSLHALNLGLILIAWTTTAIIRVRMGHAPVARYNPAGFVHYARLNWIRVFVWTARSAVVTVMLHLAHAARVG